MYWSTGSQRSAIAPSKARVASLGERKRRKYHELSTNVSIVSVSRRAGLPHFGQVTETNVFDVVSGESPAGRNSTSSGSSTGRSASGTGTRPQPASQ